MQCCPPRVSHVFISEYVILGSILGVLREYSIQYTWYTWCCEYSQFESIPPANQGTAHNGNNGNTIRSTQPQNIAGIGSILPN